MNKNDKLKEELAESRHDDLFGVALGAFAFAGVSVALIYWQIHGWMWAAVLLFVLVVALVRVGSVANRKKRARKELIAQLDNQEQPSKPQTLTS
jgi:Flp pilus assembly protein TadB